MSDGQVVIDITGDASRYRAAVSSLVSSTQKQVAALGSGLQSIGKGITAAVTAPVVGIGTAAVGTAVSFLSLRESAQTAFETMLGSGEAASKMIGDLYTFAKKTPFKFDGMLESSQQLISMGMAADNVIPTLTAVGDAAAASGKGQEGFKAITTALGKMQAQGQVSLDDLWSLSDNGVQALQILANKSGQSIEDMKKAISDGTVDANWAIQALVEGIEDGTDGMAGQTAKMGGMMGELKNTFKGACDSMTSSIRNFGLAVVGEYGTTDAESSKFLGSLTRIVQQATAIIDAASKKWSDAGLSIEPMAAGSRHALGGRGRDPKWILRHCHIVKAGSHRGGATRPRDFGRRVSLVGAAMAARRARVRGASAAGTLKSAAKGAGEFASGILGAALPAAKDFTQSLAHGLIPQSAFDTAKQLSTDLAYGFRDAKNDIAEAFGGVKDKIASKFSGISDTVGAKLAPIKDKVGGLTSVLGESAKNAVDTFAAKPDLSPAEKAKGALGKVGQAAGGSPRARPWRPACRGGRDRLLGPGLAAAASGADLGRRWRTISFPTCSRSPPTCRLADQASRSSPRWSRRWWTTCPPSSPRSSRRFSRSSGFCRRSCRR
ncbi:MAG: tape measure protein [Eggerthella lenta]